MSPEIENLMNMALADGEVTEKERGIILRKAEALGEDKDEVEMILDGKIALMIKEQSSNHTILKINKEGDNKKCPACGSPFNSFTTFCKDCGHEFQNVSKNSTIEDFISFFTSIDEQIKNEYVKNGEDYQDVGWAGNKIKKSSFLMDNEIGKRIHKKKIELISIFEVPNSKEEILSFLSIAISEASKNIPFNLVLGGNKEIKEIKSAWFTKSKNLIFKSRLLFKDDKKTLDEIENYAKQLGI